MSASDTSDNRTLFAGRVLALDHQYFLFADEGTDLPDGEDPTGVLAATEDVLVIFCGTDTGWVDLTITMSAPTNQTQWADWDDVAEASLADGQDGLWLANGDSSAVKGGNLTGGGRIFRVRVMVKDRDGQDEGTARTRERHHVQLWADPLGAPRLLQARDTTGLLNGRSLPVSVERS